MKTILCLLILFFNCALCAQNEKTIITEKSELKWTAKNSITGDYTGTLSFKSGSLIVKEMQVISANIQVDMLSLVAENKELQEHIRGEDFFDVKKYPSSSFRLTDAAKITNDSIQGTGILTIIDESTEIKCPVLIQSSERYLIVKGQLMIDRTKFGIYHNNSSFMQRMKEKAIVDEFEIEFSLYFE